MMSVGPLTYQMGIEDMSDMFVRGSTKYLRVRGSEYCSEVYIHRNFSDTSSQSGRSILSSVCKYSQ